MSAELELTGWRRMTSELYAAVRAEDHPQRGHALWPRGIPYAIIGRPGAYP